MYAVGYGRIMPVSYTHLDVYKRQVHINSLGSLFSSGTFDARNNFKTFWGGGEYSYGAGLTWQETFEKMLEDVYKRQGPYIKWH